MSAPTLRRGLNRDGTDNIDRTELKRQWYDVYHIMLSTSWLNFLGSTILVYLCINFFYGILYFLIGPEGLHGHDAHTSYEFFLEALFFSVQTFSTIGYGRVAPVGLIPNVLVSVEAFTGMMSIAVMSGLLFARFSRPTARIFFSENAIIANYMGEKSFMFRMANARLNQIAEANVSLMLLKSIITPEGMVMRKQYDLKLARPRSQFFAASWLVSHPINEDSPLFEMTDAELRSASCEIFVSVMGHDMTFSQTIRSRFSYIPDEILWDRQFEDMVSRKNGKLFVDIAKISLLK